MTPKDLEVLVALPAGEWPSSQVFATAPAEVIAVWATHLVDALNRLWLARHPKSRVVSSAIEAAEMHRLSPSAKSREFLSIVQTALTKERTRTLGYDHRLVEAVRGFVAAVRAGSDAAELYSCAEAHLLHVLSVKGVYDAEAAVRQQLLAWMQCTVERIPTVQAALDAFADQS